MLIVGTTENGSAAIREVTAERLALFAAVSSSVSFNIAVPIRPWSAVLN